MKQKLLSFLVLCSLLIGVANAQNRTVTGRVTSATDQTPLQGVTVRVAGSSTATQTNSVGSYSISAPNGSSLVFSSLGYETKTVTVGSQSVINVELEEGSQSVDEIVVTGYGEVQRTKFTGAATVLKAEVTENRPVGSFTQVLQGRVPGMLVNSGSGMPGANATITIRGVKSIQGAGAQPLFIIDGVPASTGDFQAMNPNDFESMTVLKDANAAALYGARAANGVVVITTKQGKAGATNIDVKVQTGLTLAPDFSRLNLMNTQELLEYEETIGLLTNSTTAAFNVPGWAWSRRNPANASLPEATLAEYDRKLDSVRSINTDLRDLLFRTGVTQNYELNARGGNDKTTFFTSLGVWDQEGIDRTSKLSRYSTRFNLNHKANDKLSFIWNTAASYSHSKYAIGDVWGNSTLNPFQMIYRAKPYDNPYLPDGTLNYGGGGTNLNLKTLANLIESNENIRDYSKTWKINSGLTLSYKILDNLTLRNVTGIDASNNLQERYINPDSYRGSLQTYNSGYASEGNRIYAQLINTTSLNYDFNLNDDHSFGAGAYFEGLRVYNKGMGFTLYNLNPSLPWTGQGASPLPTDGNATMPQNASSASSGYGIRSIFATFNYDFMDRVSANFAVRQDGTSRIVNKNHRQITTWSAGARWNLHNESFLKDQSALNTLVIRAAYGITPNIGSITTTTYGVQMASIANYVGTQVPTFGTTSYVGSPVVAIQPSTPGNPDYKIENIRKANIGLEFSTWSNRARFNFDFYKENTFDLFVNQPLSATTGFANLAINAGEMQNRGIEGVIDLDIVRTSDFGFTASWNHAINENKIVDLGLVNEYFLGTFVIREGLPYGTHYTYDYLGADPQTGRPTYRTEDGGVVDDIAQADQFAEFGTYIPKHTGGVNLDFRYKRFSVNALFSYQFDVVRSNNVRNWITDGTRGNTAAVNQSRELLTNQWRQPGDNAFFANPLYAKGFTNSDLQNAKFLRFRALNLAYNLPPININGKQVLKGANIYTNFHNLAVWSPWAGTDPEDNNNISLVEYPNPRMIVFGVDFKF